ncbi:hypothetical protein DL765_000173 [Monosporascus sp. GIB2]|nr:hypothetical protein DL765_000173 [Monosporascus sp. GIB2]
MAGSQTWDSVSNRRASWCPLCGVMVDRLQTSPGDPSTRLSWLGEVRAVHSTNAASDVSVTGVGYLDYANEVRANVDESLRYDYRPHAPPPPEAHEDGGGEAGGGGGQSEEAPPPCFPVHDACWELLRDRVGDSVPPCVVARHLFAVLHNTPVNGEGTLVPAPGPGDQEEQGDEPNEKDHYGGAAAFQKPDRHRDYTLVNMSRFSSYLTADPRKPLPEHEDRLWVAVQAMSKPFFPISTKDGRVLVGDGEAPERKYYDPSSSPSGGVREGDGGSRDDEGKAHYKQDPFTRLPSELVTLILCHLPTRDLGSLRLASRYVADVSAPRHLTPLYWESRFTPEGEMGFVFAGPWSKEEKKKQRDWRQLYLKARATLSCAGLSPGFRNRRRIWAALWHVAEAVRLRLVNDAPFRCSESGAVEPLGETQKGRYCEGESGGDPTTLYRNLEISLPAGLRAGDTVAADAELDPELIGPAARAELRYKSCRLFGLGEMTLPDEQGETVAATTRLDVSLVYYNGRTHVCGFRASRAAPGDDRWAEVSRAGYVSPWRQRSVVLGTGEALREIEVAMSTTGVQGLRFHIQGKETQDGRRHTETWAGFVVGVDACRVILLSLIEKPDQGYWHDDGMLYQPHRQRFVELWNPCPLPQAKKILGWQHERHSLGKQPFNLCLEMNFGASSDEEPGRLLRSFVSVTVYMGGFPNVFLGMAFSYADGRKRRFGRRTYYVDSATEVPAIEQSFPLDGPGGEFIVGLASTHSGYVDDVLERIKFFTNRGRMAEFRLYYKNGKDQIRGERTRVYVAPEDGRVLTRFFAKFPGGYFRDFAAESSTLEGSSPREEGTVASHEVFDGIQDDGNSIPITEPLLVSAHEMLGYPRGFAFTAGRLSGVRRIRVSGGKPGHSRSEHHVSGVRLEYNDDGSDAIILGQWIQEFDGEGEGALELAPGDRVVKMTTWHDFTNTHKRIKFGPITRLWLRTARGSERTFPPSGWAKRNGQVCLEYRENPYEELGGILWGCNYEWDHVRALYHPKSSSSPLPYPLERAPALVYTPKVRQRSDVYGPISNDSWWVVREQVFMWEQIVTIATTDEAENKQQVDDPATAIEVSYKEDVGGDPTGISLIYASGAIVTIGKRSEKRVTRRELDGLGGEALLRMDIGLRRGNRFGFIRFHTNRSRILDFRDTLDHPCAIHARTVYMLAPDAPPSSISSPHSSPPLPTRREEPPPQKPSSPSSSSLSKSPRGHRAQQTGADRSGTAPRGKARNFAGFRISSVPASFPRPHEGKIVVREEPFPEDAGEFVGFWAVPRRQDRSLRYGMFGPVFTGKKKTAP